jgi:predicted NUDIX family NTP pyrophosphohydrolase
MAGRRSAGLLPYRTADDGTISVFLVHPGGPFWKSKEEHAWSIPKGEFGPDEDAEETAEREFLEELGVPVPEGPRIPLGTVRQSGGKEVTAWAVRTQDLSADAIVSNEFEMEWPPRSGTRATFPEIDRARWMSVPEAHDLLVRAQTEFLARLASALEAP